MGSADFLAGDNLYTPLKNLVLNSSRLPLSVCKIYLKIKAAIFGSGHIK